MGEDVAKGENASEALSLFIRCCSALLCFPDGRGRASKNASGTIIQTNGKKFVILTVKHILSEWSLSDKEKADQVEIVLYKKNTLRSVIHSLIPHPNLDIMMIVLNSGNDSGLIDRFIDVETIQPNREKYEETDLLFLSGFPFGLEKTDIKNRRQEIPFLHIPLVPDNVALRENRAIVEWNILADDPRPELGNLPPYGMSGSGFWEFRTVNKGDIWSPAKCIRLAGIQESWDPCTRKVFVVPSIEWADWARVECDKIDAVMPV